MADEKTAVEELAERLLKCDCGHWISEHNGLGCYARLSYQPLVTCPCKEDDNRHEYGLLVRRLPEVLLETGRLGAVEALRDVAKAIEYYPTSGDIEVTGLARAFLIVRQAQARLSEQGGNRG